MASGNKTVQVTGYDTLKFSWWENSQDVANNRTVIGWKIELISTDYGRINSSGGDPWSATINGTKYSGSCDVSIGNNTTKTLASGTTTVPHGSDGKKVFSYSFTVSFDGIYFSGSNIGVKSGSGSGTLTTIPRTSSFTIPSSAAAGANIPASITRAVSSFMHDVKIQLGNKTQTYTGIATSVNVTVPLAWLDQIPDATSGTLTVTVTTKSGSTVIGSSSKTMSITVPASVLPTVSIQSVTPIDQTWGLYIQGKSKVKIQLSAAGIYGSTIKSYSIAGAGYTGTTNPYTTGILLTPGAQEFTCRVVDSRGRSAEVKTSITVTAYEPPKFDSVQAFRSDADGASDRAGAYAYVKASRTYSSCGGNNTSSMTVAYKAENASSYGTAVSLQHGVGKIIGGSLATNVKYLVKITVADYFTSVYQELVIETDKYRAVLGEESAGILMYPPDGGKGVYVTLLHSDGDIYQAGKKLNDLFAAIGHSHALSSSAITGTLPITKGGTGATTAAGARNALGLGNTTGALPIANGGTGAGTIIDAFKNFKIYFGKFSINANANWYDASVSNLSGGQISSCGAKSIVIAQNGNLSVRNTSIVGVNRKSASVYTLSFGSSFTGVMNINSMVIDLS